MAARKLHLRPKEIGSFAAVQTQLSKHVAGGASQTNSACIAAQVIFLKHTRGARYE
jgi:hypothetical protein